MTGKIISFMFLYMILFSVSFAQSPNLILGPSYSAKDKLTYEKFVGSTNNEFYIIRKGKTKGKKYLTYFLEKYDTKNLTLLISSEINITQNGQIELEYYDNDIKPASFVKDNKVFIFYTGKEKTSPNKSIYLLMVQIDKPLFNINPLLIYTFEERSIKSYIRYSPDRTKTVVIYLTMKGSYSCVIDNIQQKVMYTTKLDTRNLNLEKHNVYYKYEDYCIDDIGNIIYTSTDYEDVNKPKRFIYCFNSTTRKNTFLEIPLKNIQEIQTLIFKVLPDNTIFFSSLISEKFIGNEISKAGFYLCNLVAFPEFKKKSETFSLFDDNLDAKFTYKKNHSGDTYYETKDILVSDKSVYVIYEHTYASTQNRSSDNTKTYTIPEFKDLIILSASFDTKINWIKALPKANGYEIRSFHYSLNATTGALNFFYADHPKNINEYTIENHNSFDLKTAIWPKKANGVRYIIRSDGSIAREILYDKNIYFLKQPDSIPLPDGSLIISLKDSHDDDIFCKVLAP